MFPSSPVTPSLMDYTQGPARAKFILPPTLVVQTGLPFYHWVWKK